jgi:phage terminase large subunit-like protein
VRVTLDWDKIRALPPEERRVVEEQLRQLEEIYRENPLERFSPHPKQAPFFEASTRKVAAFAGNRFGKTTALVVKSFIQHVPRDQLPERLRPYHLVKGDRPTTGRLLCPSFKVMEGVNLPAMRQWAPRRFLHKGSFDSAWDKSNRVLRFADGGYLEVFTYEQDADKMGGASLDYVAFDEPPPYNIYDECRWRVVDRDGFQMFAMTPVNMSGGGIGWVYRELWKQRENPDITVVTGAIHDNPTLSRAAIDAVLASYGEDDPLRRAREFGEFVHLGGVIYPGGFEAILVDEPDAKHVKDLDIVVGIDPGLKNAAFVWVGFDNDNVAVVFDEVLLQEKTPADYARAIRQTNARWGIDNPLYVIDPSARNRALINAESVEAELQRQGIVTVHGSNPVEAGIQQVRGRMKAGRLYVSKNCRGLRDEAEEYRMEDRPDGEFKVVKENDHRLDALRYAVMSRAWDPLWEESSMPALGWQPDRALSAPDLRRLAPTHIPAGSLGSLV